MLSRTVAEFLKRDPSIVNDEDEASNTPLHLAASGGHVKCCKALLENGAEVDARWVKISGVRANTCCQETELNNLSISMKKILRTNSHQCEFLSILSWLSMRRRSQVHTKNKGLKITEEKLLPFDLSVNLERSAGQRL